MADLMPNTQLGSARLRLQRNELRLNMERLQVRLLEMEEESRHILDNIAASERKISEMTAQLGDDDG